MLRFIRTVFAIIGVLVVGFILVAVLSHSTSHVPEDNVPGNAYTSVADKHNTVEKSPQPVLKVSALRLYLAYHANEVSADNDYRGKPLEVNGLVARISKDFLDHVVVNLAAPNQFEEVTAYLARGQEGRAASLHIGAIITVYCNGGGMLIGSPVLRDCEFVEEPDRSSDLPESLPDATPDENGVYPIANGVVPPELLERYEPEFSEEARAQKISGTVRVRLVVNTVGLPQDLQVVQPLGAGLDEKALEAVQHYKFKPATYKGKPVPTAMMVDVTFQIF